LDHVNRITTLIANLSAFMIPMVH